jgi:hypothetical protein
MSAREMSFENGRRTKPTQNCVQQSTGSDTGRVDRSDSATTALWPYAFMYLRIDCAVGIATGYGVDDGWFGV